MITGGETIVDTQTPEEVRQGDTSCRKRISDSRKARGIRNASVSTMPKIPCCTNSCMHPSTDVCNSPRPRIIVCAPVVPHEESLLGLAMPAAGSPQGFRNSTPSRTRRSQATSLHCDESAVSPPTIASQVCIPKLDCTAGRQQLVSQLPSRQLLSTQRPRRPSLEILAICNRSQPSGTSQQQVASLLGR